MYPLLFIGITILWGTSFLLMKKTLLVFEPVTVAAVRMVFGSVTLSILWYWRGTRWPFTARDWPRLVLMALVAYIVPFVVQPTVIQLVERYANHGSAFGAMMVSFVPLLTIIVSLPMLGMRPSARQLLGVLGGMVFIGWLYRNELSMNVPWWCLALGSITPLCYALGNTYIKRRWSDKPVTVMIATFLAISALPTTPYALAVEEITINESFIMACVCLVTLGVVNTGLSSYMFFKIVQDRGPLYAGMTAYTIPCTAIVLAWLDGEAIRVGQLVPIAGVLAMVALVQVPVLKTQAGRPQAR